MIEQKNIMKILAGVLVSPALIAFSGLFPHQAAQSYSEEFQMSLNLPEKPPYHGAPSRTAGGGVRGNDCVAIDDPELSALIPTNNVWTTRSNRPTFLWYLPATKAKTAEFVILDRNDTEIYTKTLDLDNENSATILQETLPEAEEDVLLVPGEVYTWQLSLICNPRRRSGDIFIEGWVEQVDFQNRDAELDELNTKLEQAGDNSLKQAQAYLDAEIYNESISLLTEMRCEHQKEWQELLNWMGIEEPVVRESIAQCEAES